MEDLEKELAQVLKDALGAQCEDKTLPPLRHYVNCDVAARIIDDMGFRNLVQYEGWIDLESVAKAVINHIRKKYGVQQ
jgi:hypothetical protein